MRLIFCILFFMISLSGNVFSQDDVVEEDYEEEYVPVLVNFFEGSFSIVNPRGLFADRLGKSVVYGFSLSYLRQVKLEKPLFIGAELYNSFMGSLSRNYELFVDNEFVEVTGVMRSNVIGLNFVSRYYPSLKLGPVEPFVELHFGPKVFYSQLSESGVFIDGETYSSLDYLSGDVVLAYGGAIGMQIFLDQDIYFVVKGSYQVANSAEYYRRIPDEVNVFPLLPIDGFEIVNSASNNLKFDVGFTFLY